jgi:methionine synthase II (cobalamin-independent)
MAGRGNILAERFAEGGIVARSREELAQEQDAACLDSIRRMEATGSPIVSDGEQRISSFATYPLTDTLGGTGLAENLAADGQYFAIFADGHHRQLPRLVRGPFRYKTCAAEFTEKAVKMATKPLKQAVIAPSMLSLLYPLDGKVEGYSRDEFLKDLCDECEKDIRMAFKAGAKHVSIDFTEGHLACRNDPKNPWTGRGMLRQFIDLNNQVIDRFTAEERKNIGIHTCPGGDCDSTHSADVDYAELLPSMFNMNAGFFLMQLSSEKDKERVYRLVGQYRREDANGVAQVLHCSAANWRRVPQADSRSVTNRVEIRTWHLHALQRARGIQWRCELRACTVGKVHPKIRAAKSTHTIRNWRAHFCFS